MNNTPFIADNNAPTHKVFNSSLLKEAKYDVLLNTLVVVFTNNSTYQYFGVDNNTVLELFQAESAGAYFSRFIKNKYRGEKL